jgi:hypothetical protein
VSANGKTLTVSSVGMSSTAQNAGIEYANGPQARTIFSFQIDGLNQTISFDQPANKIFGDAPFAVSATASSGLPVSFAASGACAAHGAVVTLTGAGTCTITASQAGNSDFSPAQDISRTFSIARAQVTATAGSGAAIYDGFTKAPSSCVVTGPYVGSLLCVNSPASVGPDPGKTLIIPVVSGDALSNFDITFVNGSYTISSMRASTLAIRTEINNAIATTTNHRDRERLREAVKELDEALNPGLWTPDGNHVVCRHGARVFDEVQDAVKTLMEMIRDRSTPGISDATIQRWINILVAIDRKLARIAITEASAQDDHHRKIAEALEELARGDEDASHGDYDMAIERYKRAWKKVRDCDDDDE